MTNTQTAISLLKAFPNTSKSLPILSGALIKDGKMCFTDLETSVQIPFPVKAEGVFDRKKIVALNTKFPKGIVGKDDVLSFVDGKSSIDLKAFEIEAGFPDVFGDEEQNAAFQFNLKTFHDLLKEVLPCASNEDARRYLNSIYLEADEGDNQITLVTTNGRILAKRILPVQVKETLNKMISSWSTEYLIKATDILLKAGETEGKFFLSKNGYVIRIGEFVLRGALVDGIFPNYNQVFPKEINSKFSISLKEINKVVNKLCGMKYSKTFFPCIEVNLQDKKISIETYQTRFTEEWGHFQSTIPASVVQEWEEEVSFCMDVEYAKNVLSGFNADMVTIAWNTPLGAIQIWTGDNKENVSLLMPCKKD